MPFVLFCTMTILYCSWFILQSIFDHLYLLNSRKIITVKTITLFKIRFIFLPIVLKSKTKKLALTSFYCPGEEKWLDDSWKFIWINQSRFYNLFHVGKFKNVWHNFKKCLTFSAMSCLQAESRILQWMFLHVIHVRIIVLVKSKSQKMLCFSNWEA